MSWRPEGWNNPFDKEPRNKALVGNYQVAQESFEQGADAVLKALKNSSIANIEIGMQRTEIGADIEISWDKNDFYKYIKQFIGQKGYFAFIPEEGSNALPNE